MNIHRRIHVKPRILVKKRRKRESYYRIFRNFANDCRLSATPDRKKDNYDLTVAGKLMAFIALGKDLPEIKKVFDDVYNEMFDTENTDHGKIPKNRSFEDYKFELNTEDVYKSIDNVHEFFTKVSDRLK